MSAKDKALWKNWADQLRQNMMCELKPHVTKTVQEITEETATTRAASTLHSVRFWKACQVGNAPNDVLATAGFVVEFQPDERQKVERVTLRLNSTWMSILQKVIDRKK